VGRGAEPLYITYKLSGKALYVRATFLASRFTSCVKMKTSIAIQIGTVHAFHTLHEVGAYYHLSYLPVVEAVYAQAPRARSFRAAPTLASRCM
jgi:hypothetical protein